MKPLFSTVIFFLFFSLDASAQTSTTIPPGPIDDDPVSGADRLRLKKDIKLFLGTFLERLKVCPKNKDLQFSNKERKKLTLGDVYLKLSYVDLQYQLSGQKCEQTLEPTTKCVFEGILVQEHVRKIIGNPNLKYYIQDEYPAFSEPGQIQRFIEKYLPKEKADENKK